MNDPGSAAPLWDQSTGQINASLPSAVTPGQWHVQVQSDCTISTRALVVAVN
jgi:uncharacterized protein (TIGR03437 family)